ncbi:hypothetical protein BCU68_08650 [Vibrio sp. 10N.286.49.B3]|uniref:BLUF domain-containing protein n=1 Tax=Vibrio sp. 10N.286.49.B3 TaxID=1880855 RepID=UPI000C83B8B1|nr:BLUF domain-containing protein [Vibrio sp. 10N.286.49.B3]PMH46132.1 hypothetical protein BCU68_08650 [Vibrio sp. 10N.286.49.B3]
MKALIYFSQPNIKFSNEIIKQIADEAAIKNNMLGITGYLCFLDNIIFQYLEGQEKQLDDLMTSINADKRHNVLKQFDSNDGREVKRFPGWSMKSIENDTFPEISIETLIRGHFEFIENMNTITTADQERWVKLIWRSVDRLSSLQNKHHIM